MSIQKFKRFEAVLSSFAEYAKEDVNRVALEADLSNAKTMLNNQEFKIAVIANMSSGKSTFINALFGDDVLPAFTEATTDCATYIYSDDDDSNNKAVVYFDDDKESCTVMREDVKKELKHYAKKDSNSIDDKYKKVNKIELDWDFLNINTDSDSKIKVTFIDTPGPNNTGDFATKHTLQTTELIDSVDMVIFLFDYIQLDANLSSDGQGIWDNLKKRKEKDKNFGIYFVINKIDASIDDLMAHTKDYDKEERKIIRQNKWNEDKEKSISKIKEAAGKHGFEGAQVYAVASSWALLDRKIKDEDDEDDLEDIKKRNFKRVWDEMYEDKFYEFLGFSKLEKDINHFIKTQIEEEILKKISSYLNELITSKLYLLNMENELAKKSEEEIIESLAVANQYIDTEIPNVISEYNLVREHIEKEFIVSIKSIINERRREFYSEDLLISNTQYLSALSDFMSKNEKYFLDELSDQDTNVMLTEVGNLFDLRCEDNDTSLRTHTYEITLENQEIFWQYYSDFGVAMLDIEEFEHAVKADLFEEYNKVLLKLGKEYNFSKQYIDEQINKHLQINIIVTEKSSDNNHTNGDEEQDWLKTGSMILGGAALGAILPAIAVGGAIGWGIGAVLGLGYQKINENNVEINEEEIFVWLQELVEEYMNNTLPSIQTDFKNNFIILEQMSEDIFQKLHDEKRNNIATLQESLLTTKNRLSQGQNSIEKLENILKLLE